MPHQKVVTAYKFSELAPKAQERVRQREREAATYGNWWEHVYQDAIACAERLGIEIAVKTERSANGKTFQVPNIAFSGFGSQGDGASFAGYWRHQAKLSQSGPSPAAAANDPHSAPSVPWSTFEAAIKDHAPIDEVLHGIAIDLDSFVDHSCSIKLSGRYSHDGCTDFTHYMTNEHGDDDEDPLWDLAHGPRCKAIEETLRRFMRWIYRQLETEYFEITSDEAIDERIAESVDDYDVNGRVI